MSRIHEEAKEEEEQKNLGLETTHPWRGGRGSKLKRSRLVLSLHSSIFNTALFFYFLTFLSVMSSSLFFSVFFFSVLWTHPNCLYLFLQPNFFHLHPFNSRFQHFFSLSVFLPSHPLQDFEASARFRYGELAMDQLNVQKLSQWRLTTDSWVARWAVEDAI